VAHQRAVAVVLRAARTDEHDARTARRRREMAKVAARNRAVIPEPWLEDQMAAMALQLASAKGEHWAALVDDAMAQPWGDGPGEWR
jgi:hypothetical protein